MLREIIDLGSPDLPKKVSGDELSVLSEEVRQYNLKKLESSTKECKDLYLDSIREIDLNTFMQHYRYLLYVYFRYRIDLIRYFDKNDEKSIILEWQILISNKKRNADGKIELLESSVFNQVKLVDGSGVNKELVTILPCISPELREKDIKKVTSSKLATVVIDALHSQNIHPGLAQTEISNAYGYNFSRLGDTVAPKDLVYEHARNWVKTIEYIDSWFIKKYPKLASKLVPLPTIEKVREIMGIDKNGNKVGEPNKDVEATTNVPSKITKGRFTKERNFSR